MKTIEDKLAAIQAKQQAQASAELEKARAELEITDAFEKTGALTPSRIHIYPLYGKDASAQFGDRYERNGKQYCSPLEIAELAEKFPPLPRLIRKDGCTSFPLESWFDALPDDKQTGEVQSVAGFLLSVDTACTPQHGHAPIVKIEWLAEVAGRVVSLECLIPPYEVLSVRFDGKNQTNAHRYISDTCLTFRGGWAVFASGDDRPALHHQIGGDDTERMDRIRWGRGSTDSGHKFTFYTGCMDASLPHWMKRVHALHAARLSEASKLRANR